MRVRMPRTIEFEGMTLTFGPHFYGKHPEVTEDDAEQALRNWVAFGLCWDGPRQRVRRKTYWGRSPNHSHMLRVVISADEKRIITAHEDDDAVDRLADKDNPGSWFQGRCKDLEVR